MAPKRKAITRDSSEADKVVLSDGGEDIDIGPLDAILSGSEDGQDEAAFSGDDASDLEEDEFSELEDEDDNDSIGTPITGPEDEDAPNYKVTTDAHGNPRYIYDEIDPVYDSDDSEAPATTNTIGNIPLSFYDSYPHIGYDINGRKISRPAKGEALDQLLDSIDVPKGWTGLVDPATGKPLELSQEELEVLKRVQLNETPEGYDPYPEMVEWFTGKEEIMPLSAAPEPKRRFVPSKHEQKRVMKLVKAIREGRIKPYVPPEEREEEEDTDIKRYDIWADEAPKPDHIMNVPAPKLAPPGYEESYNPPAEYLPDEREKKEWEEADDEDREKEYLPTSHDALRKVPGYARFINEKFERCLDLYLAPRVRRNKLNIDPESLLPKLPSPEELRPFPSSCAATFRGHDGMVRSASIDPSGCWAATGGGDGTVRVWDISLGRQVWHVKLSAEDPVNAVRWRPGREAQIIAAACGDGLYLIVPPVCDPEIEASSQALLDAGWGFAATSNGASTQKSGAESWARPGPKLEAQGISILIPLRSAIKHVSWHRRGDYLTTVAPAGQSRAVAILTISKHLTQFPFRRLRGLPQAAHFHPSKPVFFVATQQTVRSYDLSKQVLLKTITPGAKHISSFSVHAGGDNLLVSSYDKRLLWHDLELSDVPYKTLRYHSKAIRTVGYHKGGFPLFADASDDGSLQVFHGRVTGDSMENATIVPLKMLRGHKIVKQLGVMDLDWLGTQPWLVSAGADGTAKLWT